MEQASFNTVLSERRFELGFAVGEVSHALQIPREVLFAIENGDYDRLPAEPEAREAIAAYAQYVGLDPVAMLESYEQGLREHLQASDGDETPASEGEPVPEAMPEEEEVEPEPPRRRGCLRGLVVAILVLVVLAGAGAATCYVLWKNGVLHKSDILRVLGMESQQDQQAADPYSDSAAPEPSKQRNEIEVTEPEPVDPAVDQNLAAQAQGQESDTEWLIMVDCTNSRMGIFHGEKDAWENYEYITVSTGAENGQDTIRGTFDVQDRGESFNGFDETFRAYYTCYYWVRFEGPYLIHSQPYHLESFDLMDPRIGQNVSQGCVRLPIENAKWIFDNIPIGTRVVTF